MSRSKKEAGENETDLVDSGFLVKIHILVGGPADEIINLAVIKDITLILMRSHGKGLLTEFLVWSTNTLCSHPRQPTPDGHPDSVHKAELRARMAFEIIILLCEPKVRNTAKL